MSEGSYNGFSTREALDTQLSEQVAEVLRAAISERGKAVLVLSGGSTPLQFFQDLSKKDLPWDKVTVTLADERWVPVDHEDSNERLVRNLLLTNKAAAAAFLSLKNDHEKAKEGEAELEEQLHKLGRFDLVILGMGGDGHTASLFPKASVLAQAVAMDSGKSCMAVDPVTAPHQRMTMTLPRLLNSEQIYIHIAGAEKKAVLEEAARRQTFAEKNELPISFVLQQTQTPVSIYWAE